MATLNTMVVKLGTSMLMRHGAIRQEVLWNFARQVCELVHSSADFVVLISSGAIQMGWETLQANPLSGTARSLPNSFEECGREKKKLLAATGQRHLMRAWGDAFAAYGREVAQVLLTHANWENESERESIRLTLQMCAETRVVPVVNENDPVSDIEVGFMERGISENDILAAKIACSMNANGILFLTESGGVRIYDGSRRGRVIQRLSLEDLDKVDVGHGNENGRGGMEKKFDAIRFSAENNPAMRIVVAGRQRNAIIRFAKNAPVGTRIVRDGK